MLFIKYDGHFFSYQLHHTASPMVSYWIRDSLFGVSGAYWFSFSSGDGKGVMDPSTIHLSSHTFYCWIDCGDFLSSQSSDYPSMIQSKNTDPLINFIIGGRIHLAPMVMVEVVLVLLKPTYPHRKFILSQTGMMVVLFRIRIIAQHPLWCHLGVRIIQLVIIIVIHSVFLLFVVEVVLFLGPPTVPPIQLISGLMVVI